MAHHEQQQFCKSVKEKFPEYFKGNILDIGSQDINGNNRHLFDGLNYIGIDLNEGSNVDVIASGHNFKTDNKFDVVISTECLEHDKYWALTLQNICFNLLKKGGLFIMTCATTGRAEHGTTRTSPKDSPFTTDYYLNLTEEDFRQAIDIEKTFSTFEFQTNENPNDLYFYGIKK
jgi:predicted SAM-dependent methyltransferase